MRPMRMNVAGALLAGALGSVMLMPAASAADTPRLTCTFVHGQCLTECGKEAGPLICRQYCMGRKNACMFTGRWSGRYGDVFPAVIRE